MSLGLVGTLGRKVPPDRQPGPQPAQYCGKNDEAQDVAEGEVPELPLGAVTALIGVPFFLIKLRRLT